jgi:hypothetical protein
MNLALSDKPSFAPAFVLTLLWVGVAFAQTHSTKKSAPAQTSIMSFEEYVKKRHPVPYILKLSAGKGCLLYFGAKHTFDPNEPELVQMEKLWTNLKPDVAFFEGADPENVPSAVKTREEVRRNGEPSFVLFLAARDHVPVHTLEPSRGDEIALLLRKYSPEEVKVFYVLRQVPEFKSGKHDETIEAYTQNVLGWLSMRAELRVAPRTLAELKGSSARLFPQLADWREVPQAWFDPATPQPLTYLNDISRQLSEFRDRHMLTLLAEQVAQGKRVLAAVGASHVVMQERALRAAIRAKRKSSLLP